MAGKLQSVPLGHYRALPSHVKYFPVYRNIVHYDTNTVYLCFVYISFGWLEKLRILGFEFSSVCGLEMLWVVLDFSLLLNFKTYVICKCF